MWWLVREMILMGTLLILSVWDIRTGEIPEEPVWLLGISGLIISCLETGILMDEWLLKLAELPVRLLPGTAALLLAVITSEKLGKGDGLVLMGMGFYMSAGQVYAVFAIGVCLGCMTGMIMAVVKGQQEADIPLIPFLMAGCCIVRGIGFGGLT